MTKTPEIVCQNCRTLLSLTLVDLGLSPLANSYVPIDQSANPDPRYPLHVRVCTTCWLVQADPAVGASEIFRHYAYLSSYSETRTPAGGTSPRSAVA